MAGKQGATIRAPPRPERSSTFLTSNSKEPQHSKRWELGHEQILAFNNPGESG